MSKAVGSKCLGFLLLAVITAACGTETRPPSPVALPEPSTTVATTITLPVTTTTTTTTLIESAESALTESQTEADAQRDGVVPQLAALPLALRVDVQSAFATPEGVWAVSIPAPGIEEHTDGCRLGSDGGFYPTDFICTDEYGEILLLEEETGSIRRAVPLPGVPPEILLVTDDAVFCAREGAGRMPDSMVCRIDRATGDVVVMVYPGEVDSIVGQPCFYPPSTWRLATEPMQVGSIFHDETGLWVENDEGWALLDDHTLEVLKTGLADPGHD